MSRALELLVAQAAGEGCDLITIRALIEEAVTAGVRAAIAIEAATAGETPQSGSTEGESAGRRHRQGDTP